MIYDTLESELDELCEELGIEPMSICPICEQPIVSPKPKQKYHAKCEAEANRRKAREYYQAHKGHSQGRGRTVTPIPTENICTCCGVLPKAPGNRFLCALCYKHGGDEWRDDEHQQSMARKIRRENYESTAKI